MRKEIKDLWNLIEPYAQGAGFDLVEVQWGREGGGGWALRIFIDRPYRGEAENDGPRLPGTSTGLEDLIPSPGVGFEDCERVSRDVSAALDVADLIPHGYVLEVSSPGLERPLRREQDFRRFAGQAVKIRCTEPVEGRRSFSGTLLGAQGGAVEVEVEGRSFRVPLDLVAKANLVPDWAAEFRRSRREEKGSGTGRESRRADTGRRPRGRAHPKSSSSRSAS